MKHLFFCICPFCFIVTAIPPESNAVLKNRGHFCKKGGGRGKGGGQIIYTPFLFEILPEKTQCAIIIRIVGRHTCKPRLPAVGKGMDAIW